MSTGRWAAPRPGFRRFIRREPLGVVFVIAAWNYPYLISINCVMPAILAGAARDGDSGGDRAGWRADGRGDGRTPARARSGNAVILKQSSNTPLCANRFADAFKEAGLPDGVFQV